MHLETQRKLLLSLGYLVATFGTLETYLQTMVSFLLTRHQDAGMAVASVLSFDRCVQLIQTLAGDKIKTRALQDELSALVTKWRKAEQERNKFIHSNYMASLDPASVTRMKLSVKTKIAMHEVRPEEIMETAKYVNQVYVASYEFMGRLMRAASEQSLLLHDARDL